MRIAIIGAGFTGLTAALKLLQKKHSVTIYEKSGVCGGLAAGFKEENWDWHLEYFYHHLFTSDLAALNLINELGLSDKIYSAQPKTSIFYQNIISQFDSVFSLLSFPHLNSVEKVRAGLATAYLKTTSNWQALEKITAHRWLSSFYGQNAYRTLWQPLLESKFGDKYQTIPMSWFWARVKKRSAALLYPIGGYQTIIEALVKKIQSLNGQIVLDAEIQDLQTLVSKRKFDKVILTTPMSIFLKMAPNLPKTYTDKYKTQEMIGAVNLILVLKNQFLKDNTYWLNINEPDFPFVTVVEHTNFVNQKYYDNNHILYVGGYYPQNHRYFQMSKEQILQEFLPYLQRVNPNFKQSTINNQQLSMSLHAQPIIPLNYSQIIPPHKTPIPNVYLANMEQVYPWDRGTNYAIELGNKIADEILL